VDDVSCEKGGHGERRAPLSLEAMLGKPEQQKTDSKAATLRAAEEVANRRRQQLGTAKSVTARLETDLQTARNDAHRYEELRSDLSGFYEEIDKLAKGKAMVDATELVIVHANDIVRDAKNLINGDTYLDRVKEFVPAGDNQIYSDVLVTMRIVQQAVSRYEPAIKSRQKRVIQALQDASTIIGALELYLEGNDSPSKEEVEEQLDGEIPATSWFYEAENGEEYFDFDHLDRRSLEEYLLSGRESQKHE
jgi:hypothetical protein